jgi:hypothetical protein
MIPSLLEWRRHVSVALWGLLTASAGCAQVLGLGEFKDGSSGGAGGTASTTISTSTVDGSSASGQTSCTPPQSVPCYDGPTGTENVGQCVGGMQTCNPDGKGFGACQGEVLPTPEDCTKAGDENCDGFSCGDTTWAFGAGDSAFASGYAVARDPSGNSYFVGDFPSSVLLGTTTLDSVGQYDLFVTKVDPMGAVVWAKRFGGTGPDAVLDVAATATHVYVLTANAVDFGAGLGAGMTLAKLDGTNGSLAWSRSCNQSVSGFVGDDVRQGGLVVEPGGNAYFAVQTSGAALTCSNTVGQSTFGAGNGALVMYTSAGNTSWGKGLNASGGFFPWDLAADPTGGLYLVGSAKGTLSLGCATSTAAARSVLLAKYDSVGNCVRARTWGDGNEDAMSVTVDATGNTTIGGYLAQGTIDFGGGPLSTAGRALFVAQFDAMGIHRWSHMFGGSSSNTNVYSLGTNAAGDVYAAGIAGPGFDLGAGPSPTGTAGFMVLLAGGDGHVLWDRSYGGTPTDLAVGSRLSVIGNYSGNIQLGPSMLAGPGHDIFFMSVDP